MKKFLGFVVLSLLIFSFPQKSNTEEVKDCFEGLNRATFAFNQGLDKAIIEPLAKGYRKLPMPIRTEKVLGFKCETSFVKGLEYNLLKEYEEKIGKLPELNVMKK